MKLFIAADMEGISGITSWEQVGMGQGASEAAYQEGRRLLTAEVNAAVEGALAGGATDIIVADFHKSGRNFIMEKLHPEARYVSGPGSARVAQAIDASVDAVALIGYHAMAGTPYAILDHTQFSASWLNYYLNGKKSGEIGQIAAIAGHFDVPMIFVSGDKAACEEAKTLLGDVETVAVKEGYARSCAIMTAPAKARAQVSEGIAKAIDRRTDFSPYRLNTPVEIRIEMQTTTDADACERLGWKRTGGREVVKTVPDALGIIDY